MPTEKTDLYTRVTNRIVADLERGVRPWLKPWNAEHAAGRITRPLRHNGQPYRGINIVMLWGEAMDKGYACPIWMTYRQALELGGQVRKGEHGSLVVYADRLTRTEISDAGEETEHSIPFLKGYTVFNCEQIDNLPAHYTAPAAPVADPVARIVHAEEFFRRTGADIRFGGNRGFLVITVSSRLRIDVRPTLRRLCVPALLQYPSEGAWRIDQSPLSYGHAPGRAISRDRRTPSFTLRCQTKTAACGSPSVSRSINLSTR